MSELGRCAALVLGGLFTANFVPHFGHGVCGKRFYTPFATPPFRGESSPVVNVLWGLTNLVVAWALLVLAGRLDVREPVAVACALVGLLLGGVGIARSIERTRARAKGDAEQSLSATP